MILFSVSYAASEHAQCRDHLYSLPSPAQAFDGHVSSTYHKIERFNDIREALIEVADSDDSELVIDRRVSFKNKTVKYAKQLGEINMVTLELWKKGLYSIRLQMSTGRANSGCDCGKSDRESPFYQCKLGKQLY